ncbi:GNAT family N-acetyltransferase [Mesorhizobium sp. ArgA1]
MDTIIELRDHPSDSDRKIISDALEVYSARKAIPYNPEPVAFMIKDPESGNTIGGLWGKFYYDWLYIELIFVPQQCRGRGFGAKLVSSVEDWALRRGCIGVWLDTYEFQAPGFYRSLGYESFGCLPDYPRGFGRYFFRKLFPRPD